MQMYLSKQRTEWVCSPEDVIVCPRMRLLNIRGQVLAYDIFIIGGVRFVPGTYDHSAPPEGLIRLTAAIERRLLCDVVLVINLGDGLPAQFFGAVANDLEIPSSGRRVKLLTLIARVQAQARRWIERRWQARCARRLLLAQSPVLSILSTDVLQSIALQAEKS